MGRVCTVCAHPERPAIDEAVVSGESLRGIALRIGGVDRDAIRRHKAHLSPALARIAVEREEAGARSAAARLEDLYGRAEAVLTAAEQSGQASVSLQAVRELRQVTELMAKITGELDERPQVQILNLATSPEWVRLRSVLMTTLRPYPQALQAVASELVELGVVR